MANDYDSLLDDPAGAPPTNPFDEIDLETPAHPELKAASTVASQRSPAAFAETLKLAQKTGVPTAIAEGTEADLKKVDTTDHEKLTLSSPGLAEWLKDEENYSVASDDLDHLQAMESHIRTAGEPSLLEEFQAGVHEAKAGMYRMPELAAGIAALPGNLINKSVGLPQFDPRSIYGGKRTMADYEQEQAAAIGSYRPNDYDAENMSRAITSLDPLRIADQLTRLQEPGRGAKYLAHQIVRSVPQIIPTIIFSAMKYGTMGLGVMGGSSGAQAQKEALDKGIDPSMATTRGVGQGAFEVVGEGRAVTRILENASDAMMKRYGVEGVKAFGKQVDSWLPLAKGLVKEGAVVGGGGELVTGAGQAIVDYATGVDPDALKPEKLFPSLALQGISGVGMGVGFATPAGIAQGLSRVAVENKAKAGKDFFLKHGELHDAAKNTARIPEKQVGAEASMLKGTPHENVFVSKEAIDEYFQKANLDPAEEMSKAGFGDAYETAASTGGQIAVPLADFTAKMAPEVRTALADHVAFLDQNGEVGQSVAESKAETKELKAEADKGKPTETEADTESMLEGARAEIERTLVEDNGFTPSQAKTQAEAQMAGIGTLLKNEKLTPEQRKTILEMLPKPQFQEVIVPGKVGALNQEGQVPEEEHPYDKKKWLEENRDRLQGDYESFVKRTGSKETYDEWVAHDGPFEVTKHEEKTPEEQAEAEARYQAFLAAGDEILNDLDPEIKSDLVEKKLTERARERAEKKVLETARLNFQREKGILKSSQKQGGKDDETRISQPTAADTGKNDGRAEVGILPQERNAEDRKGNAGRGEAAKHPPKDKGFVAKVVDFFKGKKDDQPYKIDSEDYSVKEGVPGEKKSGPYQQDIFGDPLPKRPRNNSGVPREPVQKITDAAKDILKKFPGAQVASKTTISSEEKTIGKSSINSHADLAEASYHLAKSATEKFEGYLTDDNGKVVAVIGNLSGGRSHIAIDIGPIFNETFRVEGAKNLWISHNHPSGREQLSGSKYESGDIQLMDNIQKGMKGSKVKLRGMMAVGAKRGDRVQRYDFMTPEGVSHRGDAVEPTEKAKVPSLKREISDEYSAISRPIAGPDSAKTEISRISGGKDGIALMNNDGEVTAFIPLEAKKWASSLRMGGRMDDLHKILSLVNATNSVIVAPNLSEEAIVNLGGFLKVAGTKAHDVITGEDVPTWTEKGKMVSIRSEFFQKEIPQTETPEFKKWFGDSKVVDANGKPLVVYHGGKPGISEFDPSKAGSVQTSDWGKGIYFTPSKWQAASYGEEASLAGDATSNKAWEDFGEAAKKLGTTVMMAGIDLGRDSKEYKSLEPFENRWREARKQSREKNKGQVYPVFLKIENPLLYKYEGVTDPFLSAHAKAKGHDGIIIQREDGSVDEIVAFEPTQIKSATGNQGTFDPNDPNILHQKSSEAIHGRFYEDEMGKLHVQLSKTRNLSTYLHESSHAYLRIMEHLSKDPNIPEEIKDQYESILKYLGVKPGEKITTEQHEKFARATEVYFATGKAPSLALQPAFRRYKAWLLAVYGDVKRKLGITLNKEAMDMFDRIFASKEEIAQARESQKMDETFDHYRAMGITDKEAETWSKAVADAKAEAEEKLTAKLVEQSQRNLDSERKAILKDIKIKLDETPIYRAIGLLKSKTDQEKSLQETIKTAKAEIKSLEEEIAKVEADRDDAVKRIEKEVREGTRPVSIAGWLRKHVTSVYVEPPDKSRLESGALDDAKRRYESEAGDVRSAGLAVSRDPKNSPAQIAKNIYDWTTEGKISKGEWYEQQDTRPDASNVDEILELFKGQEMEDADIDSINSMAYNAIVEMEQKKEKAKAAIEEAKQDLEIIGTSAILSDDQVPVKFSPKFMTPEQLKSVPKSMVSEELGQSPDVLADLFGFKSGDELIQGIAGAEDRNVVAAREADAVMKENHGDMLTDGTIAQEAMDLVHSDKQAKVLVESMKLLAKKDFSKVKGLVQKITKPIPRIEQVRIQAEAFIGNTRVSEIRPTYYLAAEKKAAKEAVKFLMNGDVQASFDAKRRQLFNAELYRASVKAKEKIRGTLKFSKKFAAPDEKIAKTHDIDMVNAGRAILATRGIGQSTEAPMAYLEQLKNYGTENDTYEAMTQMVKEATRTPGSFAQIPYAEFEAMDEAIRSLWNLSGFVKQIEIDGKVQALDEAIDTLVARNDVLTKDKEKPTHGSTVTEGQKKMIWAQDLAVAIRTIRSWTDEKDGSDPSRPYSRTFTRKMADHTSDYRLAKEKYTQEIHNNLKKLEGMMDTAPIWSAELNYLFRNGMPEVMGALQHTGNLSNMSKLLRGNNIDGAFWGNENEDGVLDESRWKAFQDRLIREGKLKKEHFDFVQSQWDMYEDLKPGIQESNRKQYGFYMKEVEARAIETPWGTYRGGYAPAKVDPYKNKDAKTRSDKESLEQNYNSYAWPSVSRGATRSRVERYAAPLYMDLRLSLLHMDWALRFIHIAPSVKELGRVVFNKRFQESLTQVDASAGSEMFVPWLQRSALQRTELPGMYKGLDAFFRGVRKNVAKALMIGNVSNALQQYTGLSNSAIKVSPKFLAQAHAMYAAHPQDTAALIQGQSKMMSTRLHNSVYNNTQEISDLILQPTKLQKFDQFSDKHGYILQQMVQSVVDNVTWLGAKLEANSKGIIDEKESTALADDAVIQTQGSYNPEEISRAQTGTAFQQMFKIFWDYYLFQFNLQKTEITKAIQEDGLKNGAGRAFFVFVMGMTVPAITAASIAGLMSGRGLLNRTDEDEEEYLTWANWFFGSQIRQVLNLLPIAGPVANSIVGGFTKKQYDDELQFGPLMSTLNKATHLPAEAYNYFVEDKGSAKRLVADIFTTIQLLTGKSVGFLGRPAGYLAGVAADEIEPTGPVDAARGVITGIPSPGSKE